MAQILRLRVVTKLPQEINPIIIQIFAENYLPSPTEGKLKKKIFAFIFYNKPIPAYKISYLGYILKHTVEKQMSESRNIARALLLARAFVVTYSTTATQRHLFNNANCSVIFSTTATFFGNRFVHRNRFTPPLRFHYKIPASPKRQVIWQRFFIVKK